MEKWHRKSESRKPMSFSRFQDEYYLGNNGELYLYPEPKDCQAEIDSYRETSLETILDKLSSFGTFTSSPTEADGYVEEVVNHRSKLDMLLEADNVIDEVRNEYQLDGISRTKVVDFIRKKANMTLEEYRKNNEEKNIKVDAEKDIPQEI